MGCGRPSVQSQLLEDKSFFFVFFFAVVFNAAFVCGRISARQFEGGTNFFVWCYMVTRTATVHKRSKCKEDKLTVLLAVNQIMSSEPAEDID